MLLFGQIRIIGAIIWPKTNRIPGIERVQALTYISHLALCCPSNETHALIANLPNSTQLEGTPYHSPNVHAGPCSSVGMRRGTDTQTAMINIHFASAMRHAKCNE